MGKGDMENMRIDPSAIDEIKSSFKLSSYISSKGIRLKKAGRNLAARCPFHPDTKESLMIDDAKGLWNCLGGCSANGNGSGGDIISFVMKYESCSFRDAVAKLRPDLVKNDGAPKRSAILSRVIEIYHRSYLESRTAAEYISSRGIDPQLAKQYRAGYADGSLLEKVSRDSADWQALRGAGLITKSDQEHFRTCVTFPLTAFNQAPVGMYGRATAKDLHLYLPGPRRGLFNWNIARNHSELIIAESIIDALSFIQCGYLNVLPLYGVNGFLEEHIEFVKRFRIKKIILALDSDESGRKTTTVLNEKFQSMNIETSVLELPEQDPNALLQKAGVDGFRKVLEERLKEKTFVTVAAPAQKPAEEIYKEVAEGELLITIADRIYTIRGVPKKSYSRLRVALQLAAKSGNYLDGVNLYLHRSRESFADRCAAHFEIPKPILEDDLKIILSAIEQYQHRPIEPVKPVTEMTEAEKKEALRFLKSPKLLEEVIADMETLGYVGEEANKKLGYLASISRFLDDPLSIVILSQSGSGKSYLAEVLEKMTAPESVEMYSRLTPASLYYMGEYALSHKFVIIEERTGSAEADYSVRSLQSRKMLTLLAAVKDPASGKITTVKFKIYGPTAFIETTTSSRINYENSTRCYEIYLAETAEQTEKIHQKQRFLKTLDGVRLSAKEKELLCKHHNAQRLLKKVTVVIPYAKQIEFPASWLRTRRDHQRFLNLIEVIAFLYQHQKPAKTDPVTGIEYVEADLHDYEIARKLAEEILPETLSDLKKPVADFKETIEKYVEAQAKGKKIPQSQITFTRRQIREETGLPNHRIKDLFAELEELEYLEVEKGSRGSSFAYRLISGKPVKPLCGLLTAAQLKKKINGGK